jgi:hypothetical protein
MTARVIAKAGSLLLLLGFLLLGSGCSGTRLQIGGGIGLGASIKIPYALHASALGGIYKYAGLDYPKKKRDSWWETEFGFLIIHMTRAQEQTGFGAPSGGWYERDPMYTTAVRDKHFCFGFLPFLFDDTNMHQALELDLHLLFLSVRLGWHPNYSESPRVAGTKPKGGKWGYKEEKTGKMVIKPQFEKAESFSEGLAAVVKGGKWGFIDKTGKMLIKPKFKLDDVAGFSEGLKPVNIKK